MPAPRVVPVRYSPVLLLWAILGACLALAMVGAPQWRFKSKYRAAPVVLFDLLADGKPYADANDLNARSKLRIYMTVRALVDDDEMND